MRWFWWFDWENERNWKDEIRELFAIFFFFFILHVIPMRMNGKRWKNCDEGIRCKNEEDLKVPQSAMNMLNENVKWNSRWDCENVVRAIVNSLSIPLFPEFVTSIFEPFALDSLVWYSSFFFFFFFLRFYIFLKSCIESKRSKNFVHFTFSSKFKDIVIFKFEEKHFLRDY